MRYLSLCESVASGGKEVLLSSLRGDGGGEERRRAETWKGRDGTADPLEERFNVPTRDVKGKTGLVTLKSTSRGNIRHSIVPKSRRGTESRIMVGVIND